MDMRPFPLPPLARAAVLTTLLFAAACTSGNEAVTTDSSLPTTTAAAGAQSGAPEPIATVDPATASTVVQPEATTTTNTTTTTTTIAVLPEDRSIDPVFDPILDDLVARSGVPVRLPADAGLGDDTDIVASLFQADENGYLIYLGFGPDCNGGNVCRVSTFSGRRLAEGDTIDEALGLPVPLPGGIDGRFFDATCGANCGDGSVVWTEDNVHYTVGEKLGPSPAMLELAWNSIDPSATPPTAPTECGPDTVRDNGRVAVIKSDDEAGLHWLATCSADGLRLALVDGPGRLSWFDIDANGENDLALTLDDGSTMLILLTGIEAQPVIDFDTFDRLRVVDIYCMELTGDGRQEIIEGADGSVFEFINPMSVVRAETTVDNVDSFDRCF